MEDREKGRNKREREEGSYFTRGRVTCLFRVVEQIYIALSPPVIPLCRCCCRTLDSVHQREIKGEKAGRGGGEREKRGEKRKWKEEKREISYLEISAPAARRGEMSRALCMHCPRFYFSALLYLQKIIHVASLRTVYFRFRVAFEPPPS